MQLEKYKERKIPGRRDQRSETRPDHPVLPDPIFQPKTLKKKKSFSFPNFSLLKNNKSNVNDPAPSPPKKCQKLCFCFLKIYFEDGRKDGLPLGGWHGRHDLVQQNAPTLRPTLGDIVADRKQQRPSSRRRPRFVHLGGGGGGSGCRRGGRFFHLLKELGS